MAKHAQRQLNVIVGARAIAAYIFGDEDQWRKVYPLRRELSLFKLGGQLCGRPDTIAQRIAEREASEAVASNRTGQRISRAAPGQFLSGWAKQSRDRAVPFLSPALPPHKGRITGL